MPEGQEQVLDAVQPSTLDTGITGWLNSQGEWIHDTINGAFQAPMQAVFQPLNKFLSPVPEIWWSLSAVSLFVGAMLWVWSMKKEYVNLDAPSSRWWYDLRVWTILSMIPHLFVYLYL